MTVIYHTNAGSPILAGDMLLSVPGLNSRTDLRLPSQPNGIVVPIDPLPRYIPVRMRRKVFIVNDHLAVGAAGSALHVAAFIDDLTNRFRDRDLFSKDDIEAFLHQYASNRRGEEIVEQIGYLLVLEATDWRGSLSKGLSNYQNGISKRFGRVVAIGTGSDSILEQVRKLDDNYQYGLTQPPASEDRFPEFGTLASNLLLLGNIYWAEIMSPANVFNEGWGGAYDLIYQDSGRRFNYLKDYTIFPRLLDVNQPDMELRPMNVLKYERRADISYIAMLNDGKLDFFGAKDINATDGPVTLTLSQEDFTMNSKFHISLIAVGKEGRYMSPLIQIDGLEAEGQGNQTVFTDFDEQGRMRILFHAQHDEWLKGEALSYYRRHTERWC